jgi:hypothetical protein
MNQSSQFPAGARCGHLGFAFLSHLTADLRRPEGHSRDQNRNRLRGAVMALSQAAKAWPELSLNWEYARSNLRALRHLRRRLKVRSRQDPYRRRQRLSCQHFLSWQVDGFSELGILAERPRLGALEIARIC